MVRFRYELYSKSGEKLTRASGRDRLDYGAISLAALPVVREIRFSEFQEATHSFTLSERQIEAKGFDNGLRLMGPLVAASNSRNALLLAYEHGSQVPDAFLEFEVSAARELRLHAVKGNYWNGQPLTVERPWSSVWMHASVVDGDFDTLAGAYRTFLLRYQSEAAESRKPYVFYNTWNFQERNKWWYGKPYLESMNERRILKEIDIAHAMGIDVFVLDTGWYEKAGDWQVSRTRFPNGLEPIRARLDSYGMKLGLWFNPTAAALSSHMYQSQQRSIVTHDGVAGMPFEVWETESSQSMCLVSDYADAFADKLIEIAHQSGARYFKWDAIGQYGCNSGNHHHGTAPTGPRSAGSRSRFNCLSTWPASPSACPPPCPMRSWTSTSPRGACSWSQLPLGRQVLPHEQRTLQIQLRPADGFPKRELEPVFLPRPGSNLDLPHSADVRQVDSLRSLSDPFLPRRSAHFTGGQLRQPDPRAERYLGRSAGDLASRSPLWGRGAAAL